VGQGAPEDPARSLADEAGGFGPGSRIAGYRLEERIGAGGMAVIYRAHDERLGRAVALKVLTPGLAQDEAFRQRFIRESRAAATVDDPHIIPVFEAGEASGVLFIAMRYVPGGDAGSLLRREGPLPPARVAAIISPVASALDAAHAAGLVHRDIKPSNMLMDVRPGRPDHVYLSDFGLSKAAMGATGLTGAGQFLGTVDYIAPEQIEGKAVDGRVDQYALACAAFELLTGVPPFRRDSAPAVIYAQLTEPPPSVATLRQGLPPGVDQVFARAMAKAPGDRFPSCREFADALRTSLSVSPYVSGPGLPPPAGHVATQYAGPAGPAATQMPAFASAPTRAPFTPAAATEAGPWSYPGGSGPGGPGGTGPGGPPRRRGWLIPVIGGAVAAVAAGAVVAAMLVSDHGGKGGGGGGGTSSPVANPITIAIDAKSRLAKVAGTYVYVGYRSGRDASAQISGEIKGVSSGQVAKLYAQQFPFDSVPSEVSSQTLSPSGSGKTADYAFTVTPSLETRYTVKVFRNAKSSDVLATSQVSTVYVTGWTFSSPDVKCERPVCHEHFTIKVQVPPAAIASEIAKAWYPYFGIRLGPDKAPPAPKVQVLNAAGASVSSSRKISADTYTLTISFTFTIGNKAYSWNWSACSRDTVDQNGLGVPGHHGCGDPRIRTSLDYAG
jgi:serine/threonine-protein kinase